MVTDDARLPLVDLPDDSAAGEHDPTARAGEIRRQARNASKAEYAGEPGRGRAAVNSGLIASMPTARAPLFIGAGPSPALRATPVASWCRCVLL